MWIKVCGLTTVENALAVAQFRPDAIGLNFYPQSKRCVDPSIAKQIVAKLPVGIEPVGLFVNHTLSEIKHIAELCGINTVQLHGDETSEFAAQLGDLRVIRAVRIDEQNIDQLSARIQEDLARGVNLLGVLIDAKVAGAYGGTGKTAPWDLIARNDNQEGWPPLILAGGLNPENISQAINSVSPWGVDVAGGVETAPGIKDPELAGRFIMLARGCGEVLPRRHGDTEGEGI